MASPGDVVRTPCLGPASLSTPDCGTTTETNFQMAKDMGLPCPLGLVAPSRVPPLPLPHKQPSKRTTSVHLGAGETPQSHCVFATTPSEIASLCVEGQAPPGTERAQGGQALLSHFTDEKTASERLQWVGAELRMPGVYQEARGSHLSPPQHPRGDQPVTHRHQPGLSLPRGGHSSALQRTC